MLYILAEKGIFSTKTFESFGLSFVFCCELTVDGFACRFGKEESEQEMYGVPLEVVCVCVAIWR